MALAQRACLLAVLLAWFAAALVAQVPDVFPDVTAISLEDLMNLKVTSVSKRAQKLADAPAAIFVITQEDIRRSGAATIPEVLRMVPGIEVARIDENKWAIGSRGFNGRFGSKLLVLIDGRTVYTPLFSGVYWNIQDVMLEDLDRIEVIRGPGATLWGANAVDGVINIITKSAQETQGGLLTAEAGTEERTAESLRYGGKLGGNTYYRAYSKYYKWEPSTDTTGRNAFDGWDTLRGGFRVDSNPQQGNSFTVQGDIYHSKYGETLTLPSLQVPFSDTFRNNGSFGGGNVLGRWNHSFSRSSMSLQMYYDKANTTDENILGDHQNTFDLDFQHDIKAGEFQDLVWGLGYRSISDSADSSAAASLTPSDMHLNLFSAFVQDEFSFLQKRLRITVGSKFEHNDFTGFEAEPNARFLWTVTPGQSVWAAVSRAVRTPAETEEGLRLNALAIPPSAATGGLPVLAAVFGNPKFQSEDLLAYEAGYRVQATPTFSADFAAFYNNYANLLSAESGLPSLEFAPAPIHLLAPVVAGNKMSGGTYGFELFADWKVLPRWRVLGSYSFLTMNIHRNHDSLDQTSLDPGGESPRHQFYIRSSVDLPKKVEQDLIVRYVDNLPSLGIPSYTSVDAHLGWKPGAAVELSIGGQNLLDNRHLEFIPDYINTTPTQVKRTFYGMMTWRF